MATSNVVAISASLLCTKNRPSDLNYFFVNSSTKPQKVLSSEIKISYSPKFQRNGGAVFSLRAALSSSALSSEYTEEPETKVKFQKLLNLPGCSSTLSFTGAGYREKVFAIIGVKVYAAALYANPSIFSNLDAWRGRSAAELQQDSSLFDAIFQASLEKSLHIVLVRDVDGKTFWDALGETVSPRIRSPTPVDESALSTFRSNFEGRALKKGTSIFLTWLNTSKMLVSVSSDGKPSAVDATIESSNVTSALFDVFLGRNPVSPTLKASVSNGLAASLK